MPALSALLERGAASRAQRRSVVLLAVLFAACAPSAAAPAGAVTAGSEANQQGRVSAAEEPAREAAVSGSDGAAEERTSGPTRGQSAQRVACRRARACCDAFAAALTTSAEDARSIIEAACEHLDAISSGTGDREADDAMSAACESVIDTWRDTLTAMGHPVPPACRR